MNIEESGQTDVAEVELNEAIPKSTMYGVVVNGKFIAKGSKATMKKLAKEKGGQLYNSPRSKVGDSVGKSEEVELDEVNELVERAANALSVHLDEAKIAKKVPAKDGGYFVVLHRDTKGMRGTQDKFLMRILNKGKVKELGSHPSLDGALKFAKNQGIIEEVELDEKTKWKMGDGRPRGGSHIENERFWDLPKDSLEYIIKDAGEAMKANPTARKATTGRGNWADQINDASTVLGWRKKNGIKEEAELEEALKPKDKKVVDAFYDGKSMDGVTLSTDGKTLKKDGMGAQTIATSSGNKFKIVADIDGKHTQSVVGYIKKSFPKNVVEDDFKPHMMYDPKTGKEYKADTYEDHLRMKEMGYVHEKPKMKEEVELDEAKPEYEVKYAKSKSGPIKVTKFMTLDQAKEFLAKVKKDGMNGIISKGGKSVRRIQWRPRRFDTEEVELDEAIPKPSKELQRANKLMGPSKNIEQGIQMVMKGMKVSEKEATRLANAAMDRNKKYGNKAFKEEVDELVQRVANAISFHEARKMSPAARAKRDALRDMGKDNSKDDDEVTATDADRARADRNILTKLKKSADVKGNYEIKFDNGPSKKIPYKIVQNALAKHAKMKPADKLKFQKQAEKSYVDFLKALRDM